MDSLHHYTMKRNFPSYCPLSPLVRISASISFLYSSITIMALKCPCQCHLGFCTIIGSSATQAMKINTKSILLTTLYCSSITMSEVHICSRLDCTIKGHTSLFHGYTLKDKIIGKDFKNDKSTKIIKYYHVLNPYALMSLNLSGCGQQQTKEINYVQKINYPYLTLVPNNQLYPGSLSTAGLLPCT